MVYLIIDGYLEAVIGQLVVADLQIKLLVPSTIEQQWCRARGESCGACPIFGWLLSLSGSSSVSGFKSGI